MHPLDNVIWKALTTNQAHFAEITDLARRFSPEISLLGAIEQPIAKAYDSLARLIGTKPGRAVSGRAATGARGLEC